MAKLLKALAALAGWLLLWATAQASLVTYTITVAAPVFNSTGESIGGPSSPLIFKFVVDSATGLSEYNSLTLDGGTSNFDSGFVSISDTPGGDSFLAYAGYAVPGSLIDGRAPYITQVVLLSDASAMFSDTTLPLDAAFASEIDRVAIWVYFYPKVGDPEFGTSQWVNFSGYVSPDAVTVGVALVPEPATLALVGAALLGAVATRRRKSVSPTA